MREYKKKIISLIWIPIFLCIWFLYIHRNSPTIINNSFDLMEYLGVNVGHNYVLLHCSIYLGIYFIVVYQLSPQINEQFFVRLSRANILKKEVLSVLLASFLFTIIFCGTQFLMLIYKIGFSVLKEYDFGVVWVLNYIRLCELYFLFGMLYIVLKNFFKKEIAVVSTIVVAIVWIFLGKYMNITALYSDFAVYDLYYSSSGLDMISYISIFFKHCMYVLSLYYIATILFDRKDILNEKK